ncbi:hypothetical protein [Yeosuana marina]|uniref:hypothetical protein n=1 Tax=Yeosuana marina TaxID=1565536 RepID=UPI001422060F|nr:hypothetical protein [Yeosuana marina]
MINREAKGLIEALRLQKLRAVEYILKHIQENPNEDIAVAIEILEDVYVLKEKSEIFEQNKNYDPDSKFSINSEEILNSLCSFLDIWVENELSDSISFCFLSTNNVTKENTTNRIKKLNITLPKEKIIEELSSKNSIRIKAVAKVTQDILFDYYKENYSSNPDSGRTINTMPTISNESWIGFLNQINWIFGFASVDELEEIVIDLIKNCKFYSKYDNKEQQELIKSNLLDLVESKTLKKHKIFQLVGLADIELRFSNALYQKNNLPFDEVHKLWENIEKPTDIRNLKNKILAVCPTFNQKKLSQLERTVAMAKVAETSLKNSTQYLSLKYRVFDFCDKELDNLIIKKNDSIFTEDEINSIISSINKGCVREFRDLQKQYDYGIERKGIIFELFIEFIDSCYLAFD